MRLEIRGKVSSNGAMGKIAKRIVFGLLMLALLAAALLADHYMEKMDPNQTAYSGIILSAIVVAMAYVAFGEMALMARGAGVQVLRGSGALATMLLASSPLWCVLSIESVAGSMPLRLVGLRPGTFFLPEMALLAVGVALVFAEQMVRYRKQDAIRQIACTLLAVAYVGGCGAAILWVRMLYGVPMLVLFLVSVKCTDIGAYFTGTAIGKHKMIPWLSPGKSWEGLAGGVVFSAAATWAVAWALGIALGLWQTIAFAVVLGLVGQFGDLCESLLKRSADVKDSGALVPEFGGILDMIDSPLIAAPIALVLLAVLR